MYYYNILYLFTLIRTFSLEQFLSKNNLKNNFISKNYYNYFINNNNLIDYIFNEFSSFVIINNRTFYCLMYSMPLFGEFQEVITNVYINTLNNNKEFYIKKKEEIKLIIN